MEYDVRLMFNEKISIAIIFIFLNFIYFKLKNIYLTNEKIQKRNFKEYFQWTAQLN